MTDRPRDPESEEQPDVHASEAPMPSEEAAGAQQPAETEPPADAERPAETAAPPPGTPPPPPPPPPAGQPPSGTQQGAPTGPAPGTGPQPGQQPYPGQPVPATAYGPAPMSPSDEKTWSTLVHISPIVTSLVALPILGPLIIYLVLRDRGPFIRHHSAQALNFQIIVLIGILVSIPLIFVIVGIITIIAIPILALIFEIIAAIEASRGNWYRYPLTPDWVK